MARTDRSRIEVFPVEGGFRLQRFDKYGRRAPSPMKVFGRRNNCRREAIKICREKNLGNIPILTVAQEWSRDEDHNTNGAQDHRSNAASVAARPDQVSAAAAESAACAD